MKLKDLGLSTKPQTKYFEKGFVSFTTLYDVLYYRIVGYDKVCTPFVINEFEIVKTKEHLNQLFSIKSINEVIQA